MIDSVVPAITIPRGGPDRGAPPGMPRAAQSLPLPPLPVRCRSSTVYGMAVMDCHGRIADRTIAQSLAWSPGQALDTTMIGAAVLVVATTPGTTRITSDGYLRLPAVLRRRCQLAIGDRVLLAADPGTQQLILYPPAALDALLDTRHNIGEGRS